MSEKPKEEGLWRDKRGNRLQLVSIIGPRWKDLSRRYNKEDRLFSLKINDSETYAITHDQQIAIMIKIIENDILPKQKLRSINKFIQPLLELKAKTIAELNQERENKPKNEIKQESKPAKLLQKKFLE